MMAAARRSAPGAAPDAALGPLLRKAERALRALGAADPGPPRAERELAEALEALVAAAPAAAARAKVLRARAADRRAALAAGLREGCAAAGRALRVVTTAPLELRISPLAVVFDEDLERATLQFARETLVEVPATAGAVLAAHAAAVAALDGPRWDPAERFDQLHAAWAARGGGWQDLCATLPAAEGPHPPPEAELAPKAAPVEGLAPIPPRAQLAWDLWRLRRDRALSRGGLRLCLAPATGGAVQDKNIVLMLEDDEGRGQWHRSFSFVAEGA
ncbi:MAG: hypothetical protein JNM72_06085 [Deltaproteobacteria bacterium]|nr:hypothetical protein [Deltaproteobacteria bacterium]